MPINFQTETNTELIQAYASLLKELKARKIIQSGNLVGDLGEYLAIDYYNKTPGMTKLGPALVGGKAFDAIGRNGMRYSIKSTSGAVTGSFFGLASPTALDQTQATFDYLVIVQFDSEYSLKRILELTWTQFVQFRKWLPGQSAYNVPINRSVISTAKVVYEVI